MVEINVWNDFNNNAKRTYLKKVEYICELLFNNFNYYPFLKTRFSSLKKEMLLEFLAKQNPYAKFEISDKNLSVFLQKNCDNNEDIAILIRTINSIYRSLNKLEESKKQNVVYLKNNASYNLMTCDACGEIDKVLIPVETAVVGVNIAPFHVGCRCLVTSIFENSNPPQVNMQERNDPITRTKITMPENSSYLEWKNYLISIHGKKAFYFKRTMLKHNVYDYSNESFIKFYKENEGEGLSLDSFNYHQLELIANTFHYNEDEKFIEILLLASELAYPKKSALLKRVIGERLLELKQFDKAKQYFEEALDLDENVGVKRKLSKLNKLEEEK